MAFRVTMYYTALYWRNIPETKEFETLEEVKVWMDEFRDEIKASGNCSFKNCDQPKIEEIKDEQ